MVKTYTSPSQRTRQEAARKRIDFDRVRYFYEELKEAERAKREHPNFIRQTAWQLYKAHSPGCWDFWRHGFYHTWRHKLAKGHDYTCIPGYDDIAQEIASYFPEFTGDDGTERLWDFLLSPYDRLPSAEKVYQKALELAHREKKSQKGQRPATPAASEASEVPF